MASDIKKLTAFLRQNSRKGGAVAIAIQQTLNDIAFLAKKIAVEKTIPRVMTVRNKAYIKMSMYVKKVPYGKRISEMQSAMGALDNKNGKKLYGWKEMEAGKKVSSPYKNMAYHATLYSRGNRSSGKVKTQLRISNLNNIIHPNDIVKNRSKNYGDLQRQSVIVAIKNRETRPFFATINRKKGVFKIMGGKLRKLYAVGPKKYQLKKRSWLYPGAVEALKSMDEIYVKNAEKQVNRLAKKLNIQYRG